MGMCKGCEKVFPSQDLVNGLCNDCNTSENQEKLIKKQVDSLSGLSLRNEAKNKTINPPIGFSWTTLIFGIWVPLLRADFLNLIWILIAQVIATALLLQFPNIITIIIWLAIAIAIAYFYNKIYIKTLLKKGYVPLDEASKEILKKLKIN